jgi:hypothetical protein
MKHILPILTLTTLTAAAFADAGAAAPAAAASGLNYNRVGISRVTSQTTLSADYLAGNVLISAVAGNSDDSHGENTLSLSFGYVFKNVISGFDATLSLSNGLGYNQDSGDNSALYGINLRRSLGEFVPGLEVAVGYKTTGNKNKTTELPEAFGVYASSVTTYELAYSINKQFSVAIGRIDAKDNSALTVYSLRYNY